MGIVITLFRNLDLDFWIKIVNKPIWSSKLEHYFYWFSYYTLTWNEAKQILQTLIHMSSDFVITTSKQEVNNNFIFLL